MHAHIHTYVIVYTNTYHACTHTYCRDKGTQDIMREKGHASIACYVHIENPDVAMCLLQLSYHKSDNLSTDPEWGVGQKAQNEIESRGSHS